MIKKPEGYDEAQAYTGETVQLPAGCYVCVIKQASEIKSSSGRPQLALLFDIAEGQYKDFYQKQFAAAKQRDTNAKWKGVHKQIMDGSSVPFFKGVMTSIEKSNAGYLFPWGLEGNEKTLVGKKFGAVMGREEFLGQDNKKHFVTRVVQIRSVDGLKDAEVPADKLLAGPAPASDPALASDGFMAIPDGITNDELPFM